MGLKRDHFWLLDPVKGSCFLGSFERKFLEQPTAYDLVWGFVNDSWKCTSLSCTLCAFLHLKKKVEIFDQNTLSLNPWIQIKKLTVKAEILGHCLKDSKKCLLHIFRLVLDSLSFPSVNDWFLMISKLGGWVDIKVLIGLPDIESRYKLY